MRVNDEIEISAEEYYSQQVKEIRDFSLKPKEQITLEPFERKVAVLGGVHLQK